jgi:alpha-D-xyloside xylohydrolase
VPIIVLVRDHSVIPRAGVAQSTDAIDWRHIELRTFSSDGAVATGSMALPGGEVHALRVRGGRLEADPFAGTVAWRITRAVQEPP